MKILSARVVDGHLEVPEGTLENGLTVTILVPELGDSPPLTDEQRRELAQAVAEADRGEGISRSCLASEAQAPRSPHRTASHSVGRPLVGRE
jgi:hypothetical protein